MQNHEYTDRQPTIDYYQGSFSRTSLAVKSGVNRDGRANERNAPPLNSSGKLSLYPDSRLESLLRNGGRVMPAFGEILRPEEIWAVIAYLHVLGESK